MLFFFNIQNVPKYHSPSSLEILWLSGSLAACHVSVESTIHRLWISFAFLVLFMAALPHELHDTFHFKKALMFVMTVCQVTGSVAGLAGVHRLELE